MMRIDIGSQEVIGNDVGKKVKPEQRNLRQHPPFLGNARRQDVIERGNAVGSHEQQSLVVHRIDVAHLAAAVKLETLKFSL